MICSQEAHEFIPFGRRHNAVHPGSLPQKYATGSALSVTGGEYGPLLHNTLRELTIKEHGKKDSWKLRSSTGTGQEDVTEEELYINDEVVIWSKGTPEGAAKIIKSFTMDSPVHDALWGSFLLPVDSANTPGPTVSPETIPVKTQMGVCIVQTNSIRSVVNIYTTDGKDYSTTLGFQISTIWKIKNGLLMERIVTQPAKDLVKTPRKDSSNLPVLFSLVHPLDEAPPVICKTGGNTSSSKISFVADSSQKIVFANEDPSLVVTYDAILHAHSVWSVRPAKPDEAYVAMGTGDITQQEVTGHTPGFSQSSGFSRLTLSALSPSCSSPFLRMNCSSRLNSPSQSRIGSPSLSRLTINKSQSPVVFASGSMYRPQTPSPHARGRQSPIVSLSRTPMSLNGTLLDNSTTDVKEPLVPEMCLDHLWTEGLTCRPENSGQASKVFLSRDLCGQQYLCYLISLSSQLRCVKFNESNDKTQLIFGLLSTIPARDAVPVSSLNMILVLDLCHHLVLYSGTTRVNQVHVGGLPDPHSLSLRQPPPLETCLPSTPRTPTRFSLEPFTSSRPPSAMEARFFNDEVQRLSPVPTEVSDSSQILESSITDETTSFHISHLGQVVGVKDAISSRFTLELSDGRLFRAEMPPMSSCPTIQTCLDAIKQILPKDLAMQVLTRWYSISNSPGSNNGQSEWQKFMKCVLSLIGYDVDKLGLTRQSEGETSLSPAAVPKKLKTSDQGSEVDWENLLRSDLHHMVSSTEGPCSGLADLQAQPHCISESAAIDNSATLFQHFPALLFALHLVYEELTLNTLCQTQLEELASLLCQMARDLRCELYTDHYSRNHPDLFAHIGEESLINEEHFQQMHKPSFFSQSPPSIYQWLANFLQNKQQGPYPYLYGISVRTVHVIVMYVSLLNTDHFKDITWSAHLRKVATVGHRTPDIEETINRFCPNEHLSSNPHERVLLYMAQLDSSLRDSIQPGVALPLKEAIFHCRDCPPGNWPEQAYNLVGREDLAKQKRVERENAPPIPPTRDSLNKEDDDGMEYLHKELLNLQFSEDLRVEEVRNLLQSSRPARVSIQQKPEVSDHEYIEEQEKHLYSICIRTMALPIGRGMFTLSTYHPVPTETVPVPKLTLTGRAPPRNTTVDLSHIETPANMTHWPLFHNGVAAGLRIANSTQLESAWIMYNRPKSNELTNEHAGFLMGLGLNGHLRSLATLNVHDYLIRNHEMTSIGLLLGIAAGKRGTMDATTNRLLSIHISALLPLTSTELDVPHNVQVAAIMGIGLLYQTTANRHIAEVLLQEIGRPPGPEMENCTDCESYSLASGLALGLVMLGKGSEEMVLSELNMADQLYHYMIGGHKRPLTGAYRERYRSPSYQIKEGDAVNVDVTSPGATLALGLMFFNTNNTAVAEWLTAPDTQFLLDFVRPDFLMLRIISRGLVMWNSVQPTEEWIDSNLPEIVSKYAFNKMNYANDPDCDIDFETMSQAYCNIVVGACMTLALKFAGSANEAAFNCLHEMVKKILKLVSKPLLVEQAGKSMVENCLVSMVLSLAIVTAGTGNLEVLRICRHMRSRVGQSASHVLYGSHMAISQAIGLLFLGGGRYTLSSSPEAVAIMLCAFFPKFPIHSNDNRYHLQALRHLYVLASEPRVLLPVDVSTGKPCYVPLEIIFRASKVGLEQSYQVVAPWFLSEMDMLQEVRVLGPRYWPVTFNRDRNWDTLVKILSGSGCLFVKQRAGHLSYKADPHGYHSVFAKCLTGEMSLSKSIKTDDIKSFSSDPRILAFAEYFCTASNDDEFDMIQFLSRVLYECVSQEKLDMLPYYVSLQRVIDTFSTNLSTVDLWQLKLLCLFYDRKQQDSCLDLSPDHRQLISPEFIASLCNNLHQKLHSWAQDNIELLLNYFSGQPLSSSSSAQLSTFLTWFDVPHPAILGQLGITGGASFPQLFTSLRPLGLSLSATMAIASTLQQVCG